MANLSMPRHVAQNIARAKSLFKRDETIRALDALMEGLLLYDPTALARQARFEAEVLIQECILELNRQPQVRIFLENLSRRSKTGVKYTPGQEKKLNTFLPLLRKALYKAESAKVSQAEETHRDRKDSLYAKASSLLIQGDLPRGKATLRVLADEYGTEPEVLVDIGQMMFEAKLPYEAAEFFEQSIDLFPKESRAYQGATAAFISLQEYEKAESIYLKALKQFGKHTQTLTNFAKLYAMWNKKEKAYEMAQMAYSIDSTNAEAKTIMDTFT